jgi:hypothetical protein
MVMGHRTREGAAVAHVLFAGLIRIHVVSVSHRGSAGLNRACETGI